MKSQHFVIASLLLAAAAIHGAGFRYDTAVKGNGRQGHVYGTDLRAREKAALLEYLKTL